MKPLDVALSYYNNSVSLSKKTNMTKGDSMICILTIIFYNVHKEVYITAL